jgi:glucokinase
VRFAPNLGWRDVPLRAELEKSLGLPVVVANDVRAATWGEWLYGAGQGMDDLICLFVGTGIGGGIISGGRLLEGYSNSAGELGHMTVVVGGRKCHCPNQGCLEAYAGGWAIAERAQEALQLNPSSGQNMIALAGSVENITATTVSQAFRSGDSVARWLVEETSQYLTAGIVSIINAFNPGLLVLGGGVIRGLPELVQTVEQGLRRQALEVAVEGVKVVPGALEGQSGVIGAAALARKVSVTK